MPRSKFPKSLRKSIRREKARIGREIFDVAKQEEAIKILYKKLASYIIKRSKNNN